MPKDKPRIQQPKFAYTIDYPKAIEFAETQNEIFWLAEEINVSKDIQDVKVNMGEAEAHASTFLLRLFTNYELIAGNEYWGGRVTRRFPRPDIQRMANCFSFFELNVHAPFYNKLNEALNLNTDEFYLSYADDPVLNARMEFIGKYVEHDDDLISLGVFSMVEGAILYSSFAFFKHFQAQGKNKLLNVVRGINFSVRDENLHSLGGAWLYKTLRKEILEGGYLTEEQVQKREEKIIKAAHVVYEHECRIIDMAFSKGRIEGITELQLKNFVQSRINLCLEHLGMKPIFKVEYNPIAKWFYKNINAASLNDFFVGVGNAYNRAWDEESFVWPEGLEIQFND